MVAVIAVGAAVILLSVGIWVYASSQVQTNDRCPDCGLRMKRRAVREVLDGQAAFSPNGANQQFQTRLIYSCPDEHVQWIEVVDNPLTPPFGSAG